MAPTARPPITPAATAPPPPAWAGAGRIAAPMAAAVTRTIKPLVMIEIPRVAAADSRRPHMRRSKHGDGYQEMNKPFGQPPFMPVRTQLDALTSTAADPPRPIWLSFPGNLATVAGSRVRSHASVYSGSQRQSHVPAAEPRAGARPAELRHRHRRGRVPVDRRPLRLRQEHLPQCPARADQAGLRRHPDARQADRRPGHRPGHGVPGVRPAALAHRAAQRRARPRAQGHGAARRGARCRSR